MNIGEKLKNIRMEKGITIEEIQKNTKIRTKYLIAIENNNFKVIPGDVYVKAFIKEYARQLGIDEKELINEYKNIVNVKKIKEVKENNNNNQEKEKFKIKKYKNYMVIILTVTLLIIISIFAYEILYKDKLIEEETVNTMVTDVNENNEVGTADKENDKKNRNIYKSNIDNKISIIAIDKSWIKIISDGKEVFKDFVSPGDNNEFTAKNKIELKIGNGAGIKIKAGNKLIGPLGSEGEVIKLEIKFTKEHIN